MNLSAALLESVFTESLDGMLIVDGESGRIEEANPAALRFLEMETAELRGRTLSDFFPTASERPVRALDYSFTSQGFLTGGGRERQADISVVPLRAGAEEVAHPLLVTIRASAERTFAEQAQEALVSNLESTVVAIAGSASTDLLLPERRELILETIVGETQEGICVVDVKADMQVLYTNAAFGALTGFRLGQLAGRPLELADLSVADTPARRELESALKNGRRVSRTLEMHPPGLGRVMVEATSSVAGVPQARLGLLMLRDVTEREAAVRELRLERDLSEQVMQIFSQPLLVVDGSGDVQIANVEAGKVLELYERDNLLERWQDILPFLRQVTSDGKALEGIELERTDLRGKQHQLRVHLTPLDSPTDSAGRVVISVEDVTEFMEGTRKLGEIIARNTRELRQANAELKNSARVKNEFLARMSHELKTPLNAVLGMSEALLEPGFDTLSDRQERAITRIRHSGERLNRLITHMMDLAKIDAGRLSVELRSVEIPPLLRSVTRELEPTASERGITIRVEEEPDVPVLQSDALRLKQVLEHLLTNAVQFTEERRAVGIRVRWLEHKDAVQFTIWDSGPGIPQEDVDRMLQPFGMLDASLTRKQQGTGLGLTLAHRLTALLGGTLEVRPGRVAGAAVVLEFPVNVRRTATDEGLSAGPVAASAEKQAPEASFVGARPWSERAEETGQAPVPEAASGLREEPAPQEGLEVLIVDDNEAVAQTFQEYLKFRGYATAVALSAEEGLRLAAAGRPELILLDFELGDRSGADLISDLRSSDDTVDIPVVAVSGSERLVDRQASMAAGAREFLFKPVPMTELDRLAETYVTGSTP